MRKGLFAIMLVAASFAGGAVVNGPGLRWARDLILNHPGAEIATTTLDAPSSDSEPVDALEPIAAIPSAPIPPLVVAPGPPPSAIDPVAPGGPAAPQASTPAPAPGPDSSEHPRPKAPEPPQSQALHAKAPAPLDPREIAPVDAPEKPPTNASESPAAIEPPPPLATSKDGDDAPRDLARVEPSDPGGGPSRPVDAAGPIDPDVALASMAPGSQGSRPHPTPSPTPSAHESTGGRDADDWGAIRSRMRALGVSRYGIDGEPDGRVRFHCVIPMAGQRAVGQQFEAEGDDALEAARTALRRVALWRATEHPTP